jgi:CHAT domain-containing protein
MWAASVFAVPKLGPLGVVLSGFLSDPKLARLLRKVKEFLSDEYLIARMINFVKKTFERSTQSEKRRHGIADIAQMLKAEIGRLEDLQRLNFSEDEIEQLAKNLEQDGILDTKRMGAVGYDWTQLRRNPYTLSQVVFLEAWKVEFER